MNTNHNRIKVSDLETDDPDKILATNSKGELEFIATKNIKVDSYNALDYDQEGKALDARQGKILKDLVNNKTDKGGFQGTAQDLANSIPDLNSSNLKLGNYSSTRNDGQLSTNKVLTTDAEGNLKLCSISIAPAPWINELIYDRYLPESTGNIRILGDFFIPEMCDRLKNPNAIILEGVATIHYATFISSQELLVNVTTGSVEGSFSVTLNNGLSTTKQNALLIVLGMVYKPTESDWTNVTGRIDLSSDGIARTSVNDLSGTAEWMIIPPTINVSIRFKLVSTPLKYPSYNPPGANYFSLTLFNRATGLDTYKIQQWTYSNYYCCQGYYGTTPYEPFRNFTSGVYELRRISNLMLLYVDGSLLYTYMQVVNDNQGIRVRVENWDITDLKYIELAS